MSTQTQKLVSLALAIPALVFIVIGITANDLALTSIGGVLLIAWSLFELRHHVNPRRTLAAKTSLVLVPTDLVLVGIAWSIHFLT